MSAALMRHALTFAAIASIALSAPSVATASPNQIGAFCKIHPNLDFPNRAFYGPGRENRLPKEPASVGATSWRCMDSKVYVCAGGASGSACGKMNPSRQPSKEIRQTCEDNPGQSFVAVAVIANSSSTWRCQGRLAKIVKTVPLDARGFMKATWTSLFDARGKVNIDAELGADPR